MNWNDYSSMLDEHETELQKAIKNIIEQQNKEINDYCKIRIANGFMPKIIYETNSLDNNNFKVFDNGILILSSVLKIEEYKYYIIANWKRYSEQELKSPIFNGMFVSTNITINQIIK